MSERDWQRTDGPTSVPAFPRAGARLASEDVRETCDACPSPATHYDRDGHWCHFHSKSRHDPEAALPSPSGTDAETLAATVREGVSAAEVPLGVVSAAFSALSGLVALVEQRERERDDQRTRRYELAADATRKCTEFRERAEEAEALLARHRQALERIAAHPHGGILVNIARRALSASAPGTEEPK